VADALIAIEGGTDGRRSLFVTWTLHNRCNYRCSYCPPGLSDGTICAVTAREVVDFAIRVLEQSQRTGVSRHIFAFSGGEPTLFPDFPWMMRELYQRGIDATFTSNGSRPLSWWREVWNSFDHCVFSYHPEFARDDSFVDKVRALSEHVMMNVDFMMTPEGFDHCRSLGGQLAGTPNVSVQYLPVQREFGNHGGGLWDYTPDQLEFLRSSTAIHGPVGGEVAARCERRGGFGRGGRGVATWRRAGEMVREPLDYQRLIVLDQNRFAGWTCWAGVESLIVDIQGDVYRAYCMQDGKLGNVRDGITPPTAPVTCAQARCTCSVDIEVSKRSHG
jgi:hypothetical protein